MRKPIQTFSQSFKEFSDGWNSNLKDDERRLMKNQEKKVQKTSIELLKDLKYPALEDRVYSDDEEDIVEPKKVIQALQDPSWIEAMQDELLQFKLQKMDVKSAFLYGKIEEEVYVCQPPGFEDPDFPDKVYKVEKALYGLHQAPKAWYETLSTYLLDNGFQRGKIDKTLFIRRHKGDILLVQVYVDDIIFGSTNKKLCVAFEKLMHEKFQMSSTGELTFFLGLQVQQKKDGIFISQDKYVGEILKKFGFTEVKTASTPIETQKPLLKDEDVDVHMYRLMIGSLMYLTSSRPDIMYLKGQPKLGLWYLKDSPFDLVAYTDSDYAGASLDKKSTTGDKAVNEEMDDSLERAATTATSLDAEQDRDRYKDVTKLSNDPLFRKRVLALETTKTTQATEIASLKKRFKKLERRNKLRTHGLKTLYKVSSSRRVESSDEECLDMFGVHDLDGDEVLAESEVAIKDVNLSVDEVTLAQALAALKIASTRPRAKEIVIHEQEQVPTQTVSLQQPSQVKAQDKGKGIMVEESMVEQVKPMKRLEQIRLDEELIFKLQAEEEEERLAREKAQQVKKANIAWDDVQSKIEADYQLAQRLQAQEQEELTDAEKARLFVQFLEQRRKHFAAKRAEEKRNRPPTKAQQRSIITELVEESSKKADAEIAQESSSKRTGDELEQESSKKQKLEEDKESEELKQCLEIIPDDGDDVTIDATPLSTKSPTIMLKNFDREDLEVLWSIVKARFKKTEPVNYMDNFLLLNLKTMFEHHVEDNVWKNQQGLVKVLNWKLYDSCGVHCVTMQNMLFYLLVEKMYPLTNHTLHQMFNDVKLQVDYECEMAFELLRLVKK
ncbi:putative ribonuclease H-like domain-containing protein [Tanacetum coccineum]